MYKVIGNAKELTSEQWLSLRKIGGSTVGAIMGFNPYQTPYNVWEQFTTGNFPEIDNKHIRFGNLMEPVIRGWFAGEIKLERGEDVIVQENPNVMESEEHSFLTGNIDGDIFIPDIGWGVLEIKTASAYAKAFEDGDIPPSYYCQIQYYMWLTEREYGYMVWLKDKEPNYQFVERDEEFIAAMIEMVVNFWNENVLNEIPPPFQGTESEDEALMRRYRVSDPGKVIDAPELILTLEMLLATKEEIGKLEAQKKSLENEIKFVMADAEVMTVGDKTVTWRTSKNGRRVFRI